MICRCIESLYFISTRVYHPLQPLVTEALSAQSLYNSDEDIRKGMEDEARRMAIIADPWLQRLLDKTNVGKSTLEKLRVLLQSQGVPHAYPFLISTIQI